MGKSIISRHRIIYIYYLLSMTQKIHKSEFTLPPSSRKIVDQWVCALGMVLILTKWINQKVASFESCDTTQLAILWQLLANSVHFYIFFNLVQKKIRIIRIFSIHIIRNSYENFIFWSNWTFEQDGLSVNVIFAIVLAISDYFGYQHIFSTKGCSESKTTMNNREEWRIRVITSWSSPTW